MGEHHLVTVARPSSATAAPRSGVADADGALLRDLLGLLTRLEHDRARLAEGRVDRGTDAALAVVTSIANAVIDTVTTRCRDQSVLPSRVLARLADTHPYTQLLGEEQERITVTTAASMLQNWRGQPADHQRMFQDLCGAVVDVLAAYCEAAATLFRASREREQWSATSELFVEDLRSVVQRIAA